MIRLATSKAAIATILCAGSLNASAGESISLSIKVTGVSPGKGQAVFAIFGSKNSFLKEPLNTQTLPVGSDNYVTFNLDSLAAGTYAISVYYDQDSNGKLNTGLFGIPSELVGFSNNAKGLFGPPSFNKAALTINESQMIKIHLGKAKD